MNDIEDQPTDSAVAVQDAKVVSRRKFLGSSSLSLAAVALSAAAAHAQSRSQIHAGEASHSSSDPGPENGPLLAQNPNSNTPPETDFGDIGPIWYSFDLAPKRLEAGGRRSESAVIADWLEAGPAVASQTCTPVGTGIIVAACSSPAP